MNLLHRQQVIFSDLPEDFETLGLMPCAPELYETKELQFPALDCMFKSIWPHFTTESEETD